METKSKPDIRELTLKNGLDYLNDEELLMLILGSGTRECSVRNLARNVNDVIDVSANDELLGNLGKVKGMGPGKTLQIAAAVELGRRKNQWTGLRISQASELVPYIKVYSIKSKEHFLCITLNGNHEIIKVNVVSVGTVNSSLIYPREVMEIAIRDKAAAIIISHNHPSGNIEPSESDINTTEKLISAAHIMGIPILDHIIITSESYFSFLENGLLFTED
ncbi:MAG: DNA repair protein RadC [Treponema sp.]|nr:DNA repair protein RadC [Treponema sp.]